MNNTYNIYIFNIFYNINDKTEKSYWAAHIIHKPTTQNGNYGVDIATLHMKLDPACLYFCPPMKQEMGLDKSIMGKNSF